MKLWIVGGFLGAGKTSLLAALALQLRSLGSRPLVLENEAGQASLDDAYLRDQGVDVRSILGGCACCDLRSRFLEQLDQVASRQEHDLVLFEPSGVASLQDLVHTVKLYGPTDVQVWTILVVDASRLPTMLKALPGLLQSQLDMAQAVVMSKADLVEPEELERRKEWVQERVPGLPFTTRNLLGPDAGQAAEALAQALQLTGSSTTDVMAASETERTHRFWSFELHFPEEGMAVDRVRLALQQLIDRLLVSRTDVVGHIKLLGSSKAGGSMLISGTGSDDISQRGGEGPLSGRGWLSAILQGSGSGYIESGLQEMVEECFPGVELRELITPESHS